MTVGRIIRALRLEASLAAVAVAGLQVVARPDATAALLGLPAFPWTNRFFDAGLLVALAALGCLALSLIRRLASGARRRPAEGECRAVAGTVMAEFALVLPVVLLVMCMIIQLALIANASLVVRYAAFAAARSAIVNYRWWFFGYPPFPEWVDTTRPERAAQMVLASISPRTGSTDSTGLAMERLLRQQGGVWQGRSFAARMEYAKAATRVTANDNYFDSLPPLIQRSEHLIPPYALATGDQQFYLPLPSAGGLIPESISISIPVDISAGPIPIQFDIPIDIPIPDDIRDPLVDAVDNVLGNVGTGAAPVLDTFANSPFNRDPFSPKQVEITVEYDFLLTLPSLHFIPGLTRDPPIGSGGKVFPIRHTVKLQSTGGRRGSLLAMAPVRGNWPLWWKSGGDDEEEEEDDGNGNGGSGGGGHGGHP